MSGRRVWAAVFLLACAAGTVATIFPGSARLVVVVASLTGIGGAGAAAIARATDARPKEPSPFDSLEHPRSACERPPDLRRLESTFGWKVYSAEEFDHFVAPHLTRVLRARLSGRHGLDPFAEPERARTVVSPMLWPLLDPPSSEGSSSVTTADIARILDLIEAV